MAEAKITKDLTFKSLVEAIDKKWGHAYLDPDIPEYEKDIQEIFDSLESFISTAKE